MKVQLKKPKNFYKDHTPWYAKVIGDLIDTAGYIGGVAALISLGHPTAAVGLVTAYLGRKASNFIAEKKEP